MEVTETHSEGLARELKVVVPAAMLQERLSAYLDDMRTKVRLKGFRPGKVPVAHLRRMYGRSAMAEVINEVMTKSVQDAVEEREERPALRPDVDLDEAAMKAVVDGDADLAFAIKYEVLPQIEVTGLDTIAVERPVVIVTDEELTTEIDRIAQQNKTFEAVERPATTGDRLTIDFIGKIDGEPFDGGSAEGIDIEIGSDRFIPGFEAQLEGASAGEAKVVNVAFPEDYPATELAGKAASFDVNVKSVSAAGEVAIDDALAERLGLADLEALKDGVRKEIETAYGRASRQKVKRLLLDALDERFTFALPQKLVDTEFDNIWGQMTADMERRKESFEAEGERSEDVVRAEYQKIAARRVRLGLLLSEIGTKANVEVTQEEVQRAMQDQMRQFPGHEREIIELYRSNPSALSALRAPIYEDKVVDYLLELVAVTDKPVSKEELLANDEDETLGGAAEIGQHDHDHAHDHDHDHHHHDH